MGASMLFFASTSLHAQEEVAAKEPAISFTTGLDIYSNYIWRGTKFGTGPSFQPGVKMMAGGFTLGGWGAFDAAGYAEADLYASYAFGFGLSLGVTDYYYPGSKYLTYGLDDSTGNHAFEVNVGYGIKNFSVSANYIINSTVYGSPLSMGGDLYAELGYQFSQAKLFVGAGNGWHTAAGNEEFEVVNVGVTTSKSIEITDKFSLPLTGSVIMNPNKEQLYVVVGLTF